MKQSPISVKIIKTIMLLTGIYFLLSSQMLNDLTNELYIGKFFIGIFLVIIALLKRLRHPEYNK